MKTSTFFYFLGQRVVGFRSSQRHLSFFVMDGKALRSLQEELTGLDVSSTVIRFPVSGPLPFRVVQRVVRERLKEIRLALKER